MKGFKVSQGKKKVVYIYENVITPEERKTITEYYLPAGFAIERRTKDVKAIKQRAADRGFISPVSGAGKDELKDWIKANDPKAYDKWAKDFEAKSKGGLGFAKAKANFRKEYPNYPEK